MRRPTGPVAVTVLTYTTDPYGEIAWTVGATVTGSAVEFGECYPLRTQPGPDVLPLEFGDLVYLHRLHPAEVDGLELEARERAVEYRAAQRELGAA